MHVGYTVKIQVKKKEIIIKAILLSYPCTKNKETIITGMQWHIFIILIVSCIIILVALSNLIIIASLGMEVYKSPLKFQADCIYTSQDMVFLKSWFSHTFCIVMGNPCPPQYKCMGKP